MAHNPQLSINSLQRQHIRHVDFVQLIDGLIQERATVWISGA